MAEKELARVRSKFVERVSRELIKQLLDDLLQDGVFNDGQKDAILEENHATADKARSLIDQVKKKGDKASRKLIDHFHRRDPTLFCYLGLSTGQPAQPVPVPQMRQEWSTTLIHASEEFWEKKLNDGDLYPVDKNAIRNRVALLITNITFAEKRLNRNGAEKDEENMEKLLTGLGYVVVKHRDLTGEEIDRAVVNFSKHPKLKLTDSVVVVIMSHGKMGAVLGVNWKNETSDDEFPINNIYKRLGTMECPALLNKPKIIIIQACRGESVLVRGAADQAVACDAVPQPGHTEDYTLEFVHKEKDFISLLSSTPDTVSYGHTIHVSFLIQYIIDVFFTYAHMEEIEKLFKRVMRRFEDFAVENRSQMPTKDRCTLTKDFYFFPGI